MRAAFFPFLLAFLVGLLAITLFQRLIKSKRGILFLSLYRFLLAAVIVLVALKR
jgi:undecaprenyl pyrophosphate phosphatase UppP